MTVVSRPRHLGDLINEELCAVFAAFEAATGLYLCFRPTSERWIDIDGVKIEPLPYTIHRSTFCRAVKSTRFPACVKCDNADLLTDCASTDIRRPSPFVRSCHARADEVLLPIWRDGVLVAVIFVGQFLELDSRPTPDTDALPRLDAARLEQLMRLVLPLRSYLDDVLTRLEEQRALPSEGRRSAIEACIREHLTEGPTLAHVAKSLALSLSRAGHVVRESTGQSFQTLVEEQRIRRAKDLLVSTDSTLAIIAEQAGLKNGAYFARYFKSKTGLTPSEYRGRHRHPTDV